MLQLVAILLAQPLGLVPSTLDVRDEGGRVGYRPWGVDCKGPGVSCAVDGGLWYLTVSSSGGGSSATKVSAAYMADAAIYASQLASDPAACPGGQFVTDLAASGALTCAVPPGSSGKVAEAYMADAAIYAQVANTAYSADASYYAMVSATAYSADASYYAQTYTDSFWYDAGTGTKAKLLDTDGKIAKTDWAIWNTDASVGLGLWDELCDNTAPNCYREEMELAHTSSNTHARAAIAFYVGGHNRSKYQGSLYGSASSGNGDVQGININVGTAGSFGITNGDPALGVRTSIANFASNKTLTLNQVASSKAIQMTTGAIIDFGAGSFDALVGDGVGVLSQGYLRVSGVATGSLGTPNTGAYHYDTTINAPVYGTGAVWRRFNDTAYSADASYEAIVSQTAYAADASVFANQLLVDPTGCPGGQFVSDVAANGTLTCSTPAGAGGKVAEAYMADASITAKQLEVNPTACGAGQYVTDIEADGTLTCGTPSGSGGGLSYAEFSAASLAGF